MPALRVLFADDEIPYGDDRDKRARDEILAYDPSVDEEAYARVTKVMRDAVIALETAGYDVTVTRTIAESLSAIGTAEYDVAIIDLGWWGDSDIDPAKRPAAGWQLIRRLETVARQRGRPKPPTIMYSMRYLDDKGLAVEAVNGDTLPLPKNYTDASHQTLIAAVEYLGRAASSPNAMQMSFVRSHMESWEAARKRLELCFRVTLVGVATIVAATVALVGYGVVSGTGLGVLQGAAAVLTGIFSSVLLVLYRRLETDVNAARTAASQTFERHQTKQIGSG